MERDRVRGHAVAAAKAVAAAAAAATAAETIGILVVS